MILSDIVLHCTLWEEYAAKFIKYNSDRKDVGPVIVLLKYCKIKAEGLHSLPHFVFFIDNSFSIIMLLFIGHSCVFFSLMINSGKYPLSVSNTYSFTRLFINDDIPEINRFKERLVTHYCTNWVLHFDSL